MTSQEKSIIHEHLSAYRIGKAIDELGRHLPTADAEERNKLAQIHGRYEHFQQTKNADYTPIERRHQNDELVKSLQLILSKIAIVEKPKTLADILGRDLDEDFKERQKDPAPEPEKHAEGSQGFTGEIAYEGSPSAKRASINVAKSYGATYHRCTQALRGQNLEIERGDREGGTLMAISAGNSHARFGEKVLLWVTALPKGRTRVELIVDSNLKDTVFDMGRHQKILDALAHKIEYG